MLGGKKLEIVPFDNKSSPNDSLIQLKSAIDQGIRFITQGNGSSVAGALIDAVNKHNERNPDKQVLYFNYAAVTPAFTNEDCSFWHFRFDAHVDMKIAAITDYIKEPEGHQEGLPDQSGLCLRSLGSGRLPGHAEGQATGHPDRRQHPPSSRQGQGFFTLHCHDQGLRRRHASSPATGARIMSLLVKAGKDAGLNVQYFTFYGGGLGSPAAIGAAGDGHVKQVTEWHNNLWLEEKKPEDEKFYLGYQEKYSDGGEESLLLRAYPDHDGNGGQGL